MEFASLLHDGHTAVNPPWEPFKPGTDSPPIEVQVVDDKFVSGGLMLAKTWGRLVPAGAYTDSYDATHVMMIRKMGSEFLSGEGRFWTKSFEIKML